jgi:hypothetical protein
MTKEMLRDRVREILVAEWGAAAAGQVPQNYLWFLTEQLWYGASADNIAGGLGGRAKSVGIDTNAEETRRLIARLQGAERTVLRPAKPGVPLRGGATFWASWPT